MFRCSGVFRGVLGCSGVPLFWGSGVPLFWGSGVPVFLVLVHAGRMIGRMIVRDCP